MRRLVFALFFSLLTMGLLSCLQNRKEPAILWTDQPEFAFYAEYFNVAQQQYKVEVRYFDSPSQKLADSKASPDIVAARWLKNNSTRSYFKPLDSLFWANAGSPAGGTGGTAGGSAGGDTSGSALSKNAFYSHLLALGNISGRQYLLPVSFNAPALVFTKETGETLPNHYAVSLEEIRPLSKEYNRVSGGVHTRMGFSPAWDSDFLFVTASLFNASFREANPLAWDPSALEKAMSYVYNWTTEVNSGVQAEDDFRFKYFYEPPAKLVLSGRILFTFMDSDKLFTLAEDQQKDLDFCWLADKNSIPLREGSVYLGLAKKGKSPKAAKAFLRWFFQSDTQRYILEHSKENKLIESSFGIGGGFSGLREVTEQIYPQFYPGLADHVPPEDFFTPSNIFPRNWLSLKEYAVIPYLRERAQSPNLVDIYPLEQRIADWVRLNR